MKQIFWLDLRSFALIFGGGDTPLFIISCLNKEGRCQPEACITFGDDLVNIEADSKADRWFACSLPSWKAHVFLWSNACDGAVSGEASVAHVIVNTALTLSFFLADWVI